MCCHRGSVLHDQVVAGTPHQRKLNYEKILKEMERTTETIPTATCSTDIVQSTSKYLAPKACDSEVWCTTPNHM
jgi:hypothetical protein